ncbi:MAG: hypothetical protein A2252_02700 [Elusimicrobia bacterium RIFOXYA2_FULL_39_19]|nr:MAG: hypothetical protein A2252_02700 [Elusimicrobia bacterium RIFOXYA2_FULL_39_19]
MHLFYIDSRDYSGSSWASEIYYSKSTDDGSFWTQPIRITDIDGFYSGSPNLVIDSNGLHVFWTDYRYGYTYIYYRNSVDYGVTWEPEQRITYYFPWGSSGPRAVSVNNVLHLVWEDTRNSGGDVTEQIFYKKYDPTPPTGKPTTPNIEIYDGESKIRWSWTKGNVYDAESEFVAYSAQIWETPGVIEDVEGEGGNGITLTEADLNVSYRIRVRAKTETYRYTDWSDWSEAVNIQQPLSKVRVYPNPLKYNLNNIVTFDDLSNDYATIKVYNIAGELVRELIKNTNTDYVQWDMKNEQGEQVSSNMYLYFIKNQYRSKTGKIAVIH